MITERIVQDINKSPYFSILADETTDVAGVEQMTFCVRYLKDDKIIESFLRFIPVESTTGENLSEIILNTMASLNINTEKLRGQGYDGASNMTGKFKGVKTRIMEKFPLAQYTHCSSHVLNLVVMASCSLKPIKNTIGTIKTVTNYIRDGHIRRNAFKKNIPSDSKTHMLKTMCETRWVERHKNVTDL